MHFLNVVFIAWALVLQKESAESSVTINLQPHPPSWTALLVSVNHLLSSSIFTFFSDFSMHMLGTYGYKEILILVCIND